MHRILKTTLTIICIFLIMPSVALSDSVDNYLLCKMKNLNIPGLSISIIQNNKLIKAKGYGLASIELQSPATPDTIYQSGSIGKQFTAMLVMILSEKGSIHLDDKISQYIKNTPSSWKDISIRHLLTHTSGLTRYNPEADLRLDYTDNELVEKLKSYPLDFQPGTAFKYSNTGYEMLGTILKKITRKSYDNLLKTYIFEPLDMHTARVIGNRNDIILNRAAGYDPIENGKLKNEDYRSTTFNSSADGSLYFTVLDLAKWDKALYTTKLLNEKNMALLWSPTKLKDGKTENYGLGWSMDTINGHRVIEHGGENSGFTAFITRFPDDKLTVIILTNLSGNVELGNIAHHVASIYNNALKNPKKDYKDNCSY